MGDARASLDPILASGIAPGSARRAAGDEGDSHSLESAGPESAGDDWYQEGYLQAANDFRDMANHWYHGQRCRSVGTGRARGGGPEPEFVAGRRFVFISSGLTRESPVRRSIRYMGGFTPGQWQ